MNNSQKHRKTLSKKILCLLSIGLICSSMGNTYANDAESKNLNTLEQQQTKILIKGKIVDSKGEPLIGVSVVVKGTTQGTLTDVDGNYTINAASDDILEFRYIGFSTVTRRVGTNKTINITMQEDSKVMDEVVVVGYGAQKKENLTGAVFSVDVDKTLGSRPIADVGRGLQGTVPGLNITVPSGEIGSDPIMRIRGQVSSPNGSSNPLILVDNVEVPSLQLVNPNDVADISVLKDAAASSIYGAKAAFGVILITTKKGAKAESVSVTYSGNVSWQNRAKDLEMATIDGLQYTWDAWTSRNPENPNTGATGNMWKMTAESIQKSREWVEKYGKTVKAGDPVVYGRDWYMDELGNKLGIRTYNAVDALVKEWTPTQTHNLSVNGKSGKVSYNLGLGLLDQSGMTKPAKTDDFRRYNVTLSLSSEINKYLTIRGGAMYSDRVKRYPSTGSTTSDPWLYAYRWGSLMPVGVQDQHGNNLRNPAYELEASTTSRLRNVYTNVNLGATVNFTKNWNLEFDYTYYTQEDATDASIPKFTAGDAWYSPVLWKDADGNQVYVDDEGNVTTDGGMPAYMFNTITFPASGSPTDRQTSYISRNSLRKNSHNFNVYSTYNLKIGDPHAFKFMAGMNRVTNDWRSHYAEKLDLMDYENPQFNFATGTQKVSSTANWNGQLGFFGRVNYAFDSKYLLEANLRYDGTSVFPEHLRWRWFPSFSGGWIMSSEKFMKPIESVLSFAKIRTSWGSIGDQSVSNSLYVPTLATVEKTTWLGSDGVTMSYRPPAAVSQDITWQRIETLDIGADFRFWKDRVGLSVDWFQRDTKNMIIAGDALPETFGVAVPQGNYGDLRTKGWEISLDFNHRFSNGLSINGLVTFADAVTHVTRGADQNTAWENRLISNGWATGARYGDVWGYRTDRLYQEEDFVRGADGNLQKVTIIIDGTSKRSYMLAGDNPVYQTYFEDGGGVVIFRPGDVKFVDLNGDGYITPGKGTFGDPGDREVIGNTTPRYEYGFRLGADYKGFDASIFFQGIGKRSMWGAGQLAIPGFSAADGAIPQAIAGDYWRPDRTDAFYPRAWNNGGGNTNYSLQIQSRYLLDMSYLRIKNITFGYSLPTALLRKAYISKARFYVSLENFFTFDNLRGLPIDPEAKSGYSMFDTSNYNLGRTGTGTPVFKSASVGVQLSF
ncbi:TonB-linked SusC/RagA family outer membrane protein [Dysgonomonas hofstadii]|uniref:TonB-linked SusC/RagA family outer membrane protein n=1 Tax=Dysgonomonas hofstadii TaxID=637886 RepID=A0A840CRV5_9BACT|nr:TonB-dependent receptor [Dysgonomonas hofstadii]MBB4035262.1 TonB-linked SusC/RagA family outer membrane protein [Dysgonomonas hofstadii]